MIILLQNQKNYQYTFIRANKNACYLQASTISRAFGIFENANGMYATSVVIGKKECAIVYSNQHGIMFDIVDTFFTEKEVYEKYPEEFL